MRRLHLVAGALGLIAFCAWLGCQPGGLQPIGEILGGGSGVDDPTSVGDVTDDDNADSLDDGGPFSGVRARVRNESSARADVTVRFIRDSKVVHLAFVRVLPDSITTVNSPETVESVELSGVDQLGRALGNAVYVFGVDFDAVKPADYLVRDPDEPDRPVPNPEPVTQVRLSLLEPAHAVTVTLGGTLATRWTDESSASGLLTLSLRPLNGGNGGESGSVGPAIAAGLDGLNDEFTFIVQGVDPGFYQLVGRIEDGIRSQTVTAPGRIQVVRDPENVAPSVRLSGAVQPGILSNGESFTIAWDDDDPDDNATVSFELAASMTSEAAGHRVALGPSIAENPDGSVADSATFVVRGALPGVYDLVATIDDGELLGSSRLENAVRILPPRENDPPRLTLLQPAVDLDSEPGRTLLVRWDDGDANDDARISLLLDPDLGNVPLDGDEILLAASIGEDAEAAGDQITLGLAADLPLGSYRVVAIISDGLTESMTRAPGILRVKAPSTSAGNTNDNSNGNTNDNSNTNDNGNDNKPDNTNGNGNSNGNDNTGTGDGGGVIIIPFPDPVDTTVTPLGTPVEGDLLVPQGETVTWLVESEVIRRPERVSMRIFASNLLFGGAVRLDVTPEGFPPDVVEPGVLEVQLRTDLIPNVAWPRKFRVEVESVSHGELTVESSPTPLWVFQQVEVVNAAVAGSPCIPMGAVASGEPVSLQFQWYGGGLLENGTHATVEFWLATDGLAPFDGVADANHRLLGEATASPNRMQTTSVDLNDVLTDDDVVAPPDDGSGIGRLTSSTAPLLVNGYFLVAAIQGRDSGPLVSSTYPTELPLCEPESAAVELSGP